MKNIMFMLAIVALFFANASAQTNSEKEATPNDFQTVTLKVTGMTGDGCANYIDRALSEKEGVIEKERGDYYYDCENRL